MSQAFHLEYRQKKRACPKFFILNGIQKIDFNLKVGIKSTFLSHFETTLRFFKKTH